MSTPSRLTVGRTSTGFLIALEGRGTLFQSPVFQELVERCLGEEKSKVVVTLCHCEYLDSTFLGCLVSLHRKHNTTGYVRLEIDAPPKQRSGLLHHVNLDSYLAFADSTPNLVGEPVEVELTTPDREDIGKHVEQAHRHLAELGGAEAAKFERIAQLIAGEQGKV